MITVADARDVLGLGEGTSDQDPHVERLIDGATSSLGRELGIYLGPPALLSEVHCGGHPPGHRTIFLHNDPLEGDDYPVTVSARPSAFEPYEELEAEDWILEGRVLEARSYFRPGRGANKVTYWAGYRPGLGPEYLLELVRELVRMRWAARQAGDDAMLKSESMGDYSYTRRDLEMLEGWQATVDRYRRRLV